MNHGAWVVGRSSGQDYCSDLLTSTNPSAALKMLQIKGHTQDNQLEILKSRGFPG